MRNSSDSKDIIALLNTLENKLNHTVFNGGFDTLLNNVEMIERQQKQLLEKFEELNAVIYEPDNGLFSRIKRAENLYGDEIKDLKRNVVEMKDWRRDLEDEGSGSLARIEKNIKILDDLSVWKNTVTKAVVAALGTVGLMFVKTIWDFISNHVVLK